MTQITPIPQKQTVRRVIAQVLVCNGCCCGRTEKGKPEIPLLWLKQEWKKQGLLKRVQLSISACLGPCDVPNVIAILSPTDHRWFGGLTSTAEYQALLDWAIRTRDAETITPLPPELLARQIATPFLSPDQAAPEPKPLPSPTPATKSPITLVLGGVRSGKSRYAQTLAEQAAARGARILFLATAPAPEAHPEASDPEMQAKIARHRRERPSTWRTLEEPLHLAEAITRATDTDLLLIDCLTLFAANLQHAHRDSPADLEPCIAQLCAALASSPVPVVLVSNEVGSGVVPPYPLGRHYRDLLGEINQHVARIAHNVILMTAGLPHALKGQAEVQP